MKAITLWQPWSSLVAMGIKQYETRGWYTNYRGPLAIHAAGKHSFHSYYMNAAQTAIVAPDLKIEDLPLGAIVAICDLTDCVEMTHKMIMEMNETEKLVGDWMEGRWAWKLENIQPLETPVIYRGMQGLWNLPEGIL